MYFVKYYGTTKPFIDFDEMYDWMKHTDGFPHTITMANGLRHMLELVGTAFIDVNDGTLVTSEQVYNMAAHRRIHVMTIFQADDMSGLEYTFNVSLNINSLNKSELLKLSDSIVHLVGEPKRNPIYSVCDVDLPCIGQTINLFGYTWLICHDDGTKKYLITKNIIKQVQWNTTDTTSGGYEASNIKKECDQFAKDTGIDQLDYVVDTGVGKVFIPTHIQMDNEFSLFDSNSKRITNYDEFPSPYWIATPFTSWTDKPYMSPYAMIVCSDGHFGLHFTTFWRGFRPCICIRYK